MATEEFTYWRLVWSNLRVRPIRTGLSMIAVAIQVLLILLIIGMINGVVSGWSKRVEGVGADLMVQPPHSSIFFAFSTASLPESLGKQIQKVPGVKVVSPVLVVAGTRSFSLVYGIDYQSFVSLSSGFQFLAGGPFRGPRDAIVDNVEARAQHLNVGSHVTLLNNQFTVSGIVESGKGARYYVPLTTAQSIRGAPDKVSMFYVRSTGDTEATLENLAHALPGEKVLSVKEYLSLMNTSHLPDLDPFIHSMVGLGVAISFLVVFLATYTIVLERTHEIGILKAIGASRAQVVALILEETLIMAGFGILGGLGATWLTRFVLHRSLPALAIMIPGHWIGIAILLAFIAAAAGASYPAWRAARFDPVDALAHD
jgi:putative ABC transport system permease protein